MMMMSGNPTPSADAKKMSLDSKSAIARVDRQGMIDLVAALPTQCEAAIQIGQKAAIGTAYGPFRALVFAGMGGSAIAGDLLRCYLADTIEIPFVTVRNYALPRAVGQGTLVLCASYSGNTEEALALYEDARRKRARVICLTTGGKLAEKCGRDGVPWIRIPGGLPPRAAVAYAFIPILTTLWRLEVVPPRWGELEELLLRVREAGDRCQVEVPTAENIAKQLARKLVNRLVVVHASADHLEAVAMRWKSQLAENAKALAFHSLYPELTHNEIVGWAGRSPVVANSHVLVLRDAEDDARTQRRIEAASEMIVESGAEVSQVWSGNGSRLARMFGLLHLGDYVSVYLAVLNRTNPTPIEAIDTIKTRLAQSEARESEVPRG